MSNPLKKTMVYLGLADEEEVYEEPAPQPRGRKSEQVRTLAPHADRISAGMSHDFRDAIAEGATHLRIGTAITGNRPVPG